MALEILLIDRHHHVDHLARGDFGLLIILFVRVRDVAVLAFHAQRSGDKLHRRNHLLGRNSFERLNILELLFRKFWTCRSSRSSLRARLSPCASNRQQQAQ